MKEPYKNLIIALSVAIPVAVVVLFQVKIDGYDFGFLPPVYASLNAVTALLLVAAVVNIRQGNRVWHERLMKVALGCSAAFLVMYVLYHITSEPTPYGGAGWVRYAYYFILISHISLSVVVVPLVLFTFSRALAGNFERHKALARYTFPVWLYVAVTGVVVYLMISPFYA